MSRLLHVYSGNLFGGVERMLVTLAERGGDRVQSSYALCFEGRLTDELRRAGAPVELLGAVRFRNPWTIVRARHRLARLLVAQRFDAVVCHSTWAHTLGAPVARRAKLPLVHWSHGLSDGKHWIERWARTTPPDLAIANSECNRQSMRLQFPGIQCEVIHSPVPPPPMTRSPELRARVRETLKTRSDAVVIALVSRLEKLKGHIVLLQALSMLRERPNWVVWIGGGPQRPAEHAYLAGLKESARTMGIADRVRFLGERRDVPELLAAADLHCQPNITPESFGIAFVEALYAGLPVVTTAIGGANEIVDDRCGVLVPPADACALAEVLARLIDQPAERARLGRAGPERAAQLTDPARTVARIAELAERLAHATRSFRGAA